MISNCVVFLIAVALIFLAGCRMADSAPTPTSQPTAIPTPVASPTSTPVPSAAAPIPISTSPAIATKTATPSPAPAPTASFAADVKSGKAPLMVRFVDESTGSVTAWEWEFGDGSTSNEQNPAHEYTKAGSHTVELKIRGPGGTDIATVFEAVAVAPGFPAEIEVSPRSITVMVQGTAEVTAVTRDRFGNNIRDAVLAWAVTDLSGVITDSGKYTAGTVAGLHVGSIEVTATSDSQSAQTAVDVIIEPGELFAVELGPSQAIVGKGQKQQLNATAVDRYRNEIPSVAFLWEATGGKITQLGSFAAGMQSGEYEVKASAVVEGVVHTGTAVVGIPPLWMSVGSMSVARDYARAVSLDDGKVLVFGRSPILEVFDPDNNSFSVAGITPCGHGNEAAGVRLANGKVLIVGGSDATCASVYDPIDGMIYRTGDLNLGRVAYHTATPLADGRVLVVGGVGPDSISIREVEIYDADTGIFSLTGSLATPRSSHTASLLQDGRVFVAGGRWDEGHSQTPLLSTEVYDPVTGEFTPGCQMWKTRQDGASVVLGNGDVLRLGGGASHGEIYEAESGLCRPTWGSMVVRIRGRATATLLEGGSVLIAGGDTNSVELFNSANEQFEALPGMHDDRRMHGAAALPNGRVLIVGGLTENEVPLSTAEVWVPYSP